MIITKYTGLFLMPRDYSISSKKDFFSRLSPEKIVDTRGSIDMILS